jgi:UDP-N-acetylglucosamine 2-epimerase
MGEEVMFRDMNQAYNAFLEKGYKVIKTFNEETRIWLDVKKELMPDMVFFTNPWKLTRPEYYILNFLDTLTCYVPYFFHVTCHLERNYKGAVQNLAWRVFYETQIHYNFAKRYSINKASNVIISGYPALDRFILHSENIIDPWLQKDNNRKRIIWAPHHTIEGQDAGLSYSNFEKYAHFFIQLANLYCSKLKFTFKPHPLLKAKLYINQNWGKIKTDNYFNKWEELENGQLVEGEYVDLFINSDALIHDSGSFTVEYLATGKPCLYTLHDSNVNERLNDFGKMALNHHYTAKNEEEIIHFIEDVVISGKDTMKDIRNSFINQYLLPPHNKSASENIFNELVNSIKPII